jgi:hypothetical protein
VVFPTAGHLRSTTGKALYQQQVEVFYEALLAFAETIDFEVSARGWCYLLENDNVIKKDQFDAVERLLTEGRKNGKLPLDFCAEDDAREFDGVEELDERTPEEEADAVIAYLDKAEEFYTPVSFWEDQPSYLQSFFAPICQEFRIPHANARGWSDLHIRANMMRRFAYWEARGKQLVLLYCGDLDPAGLKMSDAIRENMREISGAVGWFPDHVRVDRFGLNKDFIDDQDLTWVNGITTASGGDLADLNHKFHNFAYVQDYLHTYCVQNPDGTWQGRKVEANALVARPEAGRALLRGTIRRYLPDDAPVRYQAMLAPHREQMRQAKMRRLRAWMAYHS